MLTYLSILLSVLVAIKLMDLGLLSIYEDYEEVYIKINKYIFSHKHTFYNRNSKYLSINIGSNKQVIFGGNVCYARDCGVDRSRYGGQFSEVRVMDCLFVNINADHGTKSGVTSCAKFYPNDGSYRFYY